TSRKLVMAVAGEREQSFPVEFCNANRCLLHRACRKKHDVDGKTQWSLAQVRPVDLHGDCAGALGRTFGTGHADLSLELAGARIPGDRRALVSLDGEVGSSSLRLCP